MPRPCDLNLSPFDLESGVRDTCDVGYLCANFSLPGPLCFRLRPDARDRRQRDRRQTASSLNAPGTGVIISAELAIDMSVLHTRV